MPFYLKKLIPFLAVGLHRKLLTRNLGGDRWEDCEFVIYIGFFPYFMESISISLKINVIYL
jgi:hypothetical protein